VGVDIGRVHSLLLYIILFPTMFSVSYRRVLALGAWVGVLEQSAERRCCILQKFGPMALPVERSGIRMIAQMSKYVFLNSLRLILVHLVAAGRACIASAYLNYPSPFRELLLAALGLFYLTACLPF